MRRWMHLLAGMCARRRTYFLLLRQKKVGKEKATPLDVSLRCATGNLRCSVLGRRCGTRFVRCAHAARTAAASQSTKRGHAALPTPAPGPALLGTATGVVKSTRAIAALGPVFWSGPSAAMARVKTPCGCACGVAVARWRVHRRMHALRRLTRGGCPSAVNAVNAASSTAHPASAATQVCPGAQRRGRRLGVAFFCLLFLARQEK